MRVVLVLLAGILSGCAARQHVAALGSVHEVIFKNCKIVERRDGLNACSCKHIAWIRDLKEGQWIGICN